MQKRLIGTGETAAEQSNLIAGSKVPVPIAEYSLDEA